MLKYCRSLCESDATPHGLTRESPRSRSSSESVEVLYEYPFNSQGFVEIASSSGSGGTSADKVKVTLNDSVAGNEELIRGLLKESQVTHLILALEKYQPIFKRSRDIRRFFWKQKNSISTVSINLKNKWLTTDILEGLRELKYSLVNLRVWHSQDEVETRRFTIAPLLNCEFNELKFLSLRYDPVEDVSINLPQLQAIEFETDTHDCGHSLNLTKLSGIIQVIVVGMQTVLLPESGSNVKFLSVTRVQCLTGDVSPIEVLIFRNSPKELLDSLLKKPASYFGSRKSNLRELCIASIEWDVTIDARESIRVLCLSDVCKCQLITSGGRPLEILSINNSDFDKTKVVNAQCVWINSQSLHQSH